MASARSEASSARRGSEGSLRIPRQLSQKAAPRQAATSANAQSGSAVSAVNRQAL